MLAHRIGVDVVGDALLADLPLGESERVAHLALAALGQRAHERVPVRPRLAALREQLVVAIVGRAVSGEQRRQRAHQAIGRRRSRVCGKSGFGTSAGTIIFPGVWPVRKKRASRRASASSAFTGKVV